jgi:hypothetical protein
MRPFGFENADNTIDIVLNSTSSLSYQAPNSWVYSTFHPIYHSYSIYGIPSATPKRRGRRYSSQWRTLH